MAVPILKTPFLREGESKKMRRRPTVASEHGSRALPDHGVKLQAKVVMQKVATQVSSKEENSRSRLMAQPFGRELRS
jgi:hypothetical protein